MCRKGIYRRIHPPLLTLRMRRKRPLVSLQSQLRLLSSCQRRHRLRSRRYLPLPLPFPPRSHKPLRHPLERTAQRNLLHNRSRQHNPRNPTSLIRILPSRKHRTHRHILDPRQRNQFLIQRLHLLLPNPLFLRRTRSLRILFLTPLLRARRLSQKQSRELSNIFQQIHCALERPLTPFETFEVRPRTPERVFRNGSRIRIRSRGPELRIVSI